MSGHNFVAVGMLCAKKLCFQNNFEQKMPFFGQNGHLQMSLKKSEVWVSKKCLQNECELHICSKCIPIMFLWCFGSHWYALLMVKMFFFVYEKFICKSNFLKLFCSFQLKLTFYFKWYLAWFIIQWSECLEKYLMPSTS